ncbi:hypothetical protein ACVBE9_03550 [Eionea flava]
MKIIRFFSLVLSLSCGSSYAAVVPLDSHVRSIISDSGLESLVTVRAANASGISVNHFSEFDVEDQALKLINVGPSPAELIVLMADDFLLKNTIEVVGPETDVLLVGRQSNSTITCGHCRFENALRVGLVVAETENTLSESINDIGEFSSSSALSGTIAINNLAAPGAIAVDIMAANVTTQGMLTTHQAGGRHPVEGYVADVNGSLDIGSGGINIMLGDMTWDYNSGAVLALNSKGSYTLNGYVEASSFSVVASGPLVLNTSVDTNSDLISALSYKGNTYIPDERIAVQVFGSDQHMLSVKGDQSSSGDVSFKSAGSLSLDSIHTDINAKSVTLIAGTHLTNLSYIKTEELIDVAGYQVVNEGDLLSKKQVNVWSEQQMSNQYGGLISADEVTLTSMHQIVRNGSRTPYISKESENNYFLDNSIDQALNLSSNKLGTFYLLEKSVLSTGSSLGVMAVDNSAKIIANSLVINAAAFENINPYYSKSKNSQSEFLLNTKYVGQVQVSTEKSLTIHAKNYVKNSSAHLAVNQFDGLMEIRTGLLTNERYRTVNSLVKNTDYSQSSSSETDTLGFHTQTLAYSPPGIITTMGNINITASQGVVNNTAYVEIFGDAKIHSPIINDIGLEHQGIDESRTTTTTYYYPPDQWSETTGIDRFERTENTVLEELSVPSELDSLFFVHGSLEADASLGWFKNHKPFDFFVEQAIANTVNTVQDSLSILNNRNSNIFDYITATSNSTTEEAKQSGVISIDGNGHKEFSLVEKLEEIYNSALSAIADFFDEQDWWN